MILGRKIGMTQVWDEDDNVVPVTVIQAGPCAVSQVKTQATDGYDAVQIGFGDIKAKNVNKPMAGHFAKAGVEPVRFLREVRVENGEEHKVGEVVTVADFADVEKVDVIGTSKGKGFQGRIKRWGQRRGPMTHGSHFQRHPGSIGQCAYPARVLKGVKMAGHMGNERVTVKNLSVVRIDAEQNLILVKDAVEEIFGVKVVRVNTLTVKPKTKRVRYVAGKTRSWKKAIVTLAEGDTIEVFGNQA